METKRMLMVAMAIAIVFVQEQLLVMIPNVQFTVVLLVVFASIFSFREMTVLILGYVLLDNMYMGGFNLFYMVPMIVAWMLIPISYHTILKRTNNEHYLAIFAFVFGFVYGWMFIPFNMIQYGVTNVIPYLIADIWFEVTMAVVGSITVLYLFKPLHKTLCQISGVRLLQPEKT